MDAKHPARFAAQNGLGLILSQPTEHGGGHLFRQHAALNRRGGSSWSIVPILRKSRNLYPGKQTMYSHTYPSHLLSNDAELIIMVMILYNSACDHIRKMRVAGSPSLTLRALTRPNVRMSAWKVV